MKKCRVPPKIVITGLVTAADWDDEDNIVKISIATADEEEYLVGDNPMGDELLELVKNNVKVVGTVEEDEYGDKYIFVDHYEILS